ncbi:MAG: multidrug effflux MFS transporter [Gammaproteobacteria bacterium]|nr:multidrug effflux MFS transporter [Gammaproteobacteria bacterium]
MRRPAPSLLLLGLASGLSPFGMAVLVPVLALLARDLDTTETMAALLVSSYLIGLTVAQPVHGLLCDRFGRRPVLVGGFGVFVLASLVCAFAPGIWLLLLGRFVQALGVSVGTVAARAVVRDTREGRDGGEAMAWISAVMGVSPVIAPMVGGGLGARFGWQSIFLLSALMGVLVLLWVLLRMPETRRGPPPARFALIDMMHGYARLFRHRAFIGYTLIFGFCNGAFFAFLATGAAIFERDLALGPESFGLIWGLLSITYIAGAALGGLMIRRLGIGRTLRGGIIVASAVALVLPIMIATQGVTLWSLLLPLGVLMACNGIIGPQGLAGAVGDQPALAGTAAGLSSSIGLLLGAGFAMLAGLLYGGQALVPLVLMSVATLLTIPALVMTGLHRPGSEPAPWGAQEETAP